MACAGTGGSLQGVAKFVKGALVHRQDQAVDIAKDVVKCTDGTGAIAGDTAGLYGREAVGDHDGLGGLDQPHAQALAIGLVMAWFCHARSTGLGAAV